MAVMKNNDVSNMRTLMSLCPGDLIEFPRGIFSHWGVYLGNGDVAHFTSEDGLEQKTNNPFAASGLMLFSPGRICIENFWQVVGKGTAKKNNSGDNEHRPLDRQTIVENAKKKLGEHEYDVVNFNCEHFVKWCRYGLMESDQVKNFVEGATVVVTAGLLVGAAALVWRLFKNDNENNK